MELLVIISGHQHQAKDAAINAGRFRPGDVICAQPDGHVWSKAEVENTNWRIVRVPGLLQHEAEALVTPEMPRAFGTNRLLQIRQHKLDLDALDAAAGGELKADRKATAKSHDCVLSVGDLREHRTLKPAIRDPRIIGPRRGVVG